MCKYMQTLFTRKQLLTGSLLKKTRELRVNINHLFFHDVHPIPKQRKQVVIQGIPDEVNNVTYMLIEYAQS